MKCLIKTLISVAVFIVVIGILVTVLINMTPAKLGFADIEIYEGKTLREMGFADIKFIEIFKLLKSLRNPDEGKIVTNPYNSEAEKPKANNNVKDSNIQTDEAGNPKYSSLLTEQITYDKNYVITYSDTTLAYIFDSMINEGTAEVADGENKDAIDFIKGINAHIREITITKADKNQQARLRIVLSIDLTSFTGNINETLGPAAAIIKIPETVYLVSYLDIDASTIKDDSNAIIGEIHAVGTDLKINDIENELATAIFKTLASTAKEETGVENESGKSDVDVVNENIGKAFSGVIKNLGRVGTAAKNAAGAVAAEPEYGDSGIAQSSITVITYKEEPEA